MLKGGCEVKKSLNSNHGPTPICNVIVQSSFGHKSQLSYITCQVAQDAINQYIIMNFQPTQIDFILLAALYSQGTA